MRKIAYKIGSIVHISGHFWVTTGVWTLGDPGTIREAKLVDFISTRHSRHKRTRRHWMKMKQS